MTKRPPKRPTKSTAAQLKGSRAGEAARVPGGPSTRPGGLAQKRQHVERARRDVESGGQDTERRGIPSNVPVKR